VLCPSFSFSVYWSTLFVSGGHARVGIVEPNPVYHPKHINDTPPPPTLSASIPACRFLLIHPHGCKWLLIYHIALSHAGEQQGS
jgi:hypothetical protein